MRVRWRVSERGNEIERNRELPIALFLAHSRYRISYGILFFTGSDLGRVHIFLTSEDGIKLYIH